MFPGYQEAVSEERGGDSGSQDDTQMGKKPSEGVEDRHNLRGMPKSM
jgi:hypothetical protein